MKARLHLAKLNAENIRKAEPRFWARLGENDEDFATDLSQAILVSHLDMIKAVLDDLGIPNQDGFFNKDIDGAKHLTEGIESRNRWHQPFEVVRRSHMKMVSRGCPGDRAQFGSKLPAPLAQAPRR